MSRCPQCGSKECCGGDMDEELTQARERIAELERTNLPTYHDVLCQRDAYRERAEKMREAIYEAPHDIWCDAVIIEGFGRPRNRARVCDCWKRKALAEGGEHG